MLCTIKLRILSIPPHQNVPIIDIIQIMLTNITYSPLLDDNGTMSEVIQLYPKNCSGFCDNISDVSSDFAMNKTEYKYHATLKLYDILIPSIGALSIVLNLAVVISSGLILKKGQQPRATYLFLGNVAMTDLITALSVVFGQLYPNKYREHYICSFQIGMIVSSTLASVFSVGLIAIDRYLYILHGLQYQKWMYPTRARICIAFSWLIGCIIGYLPLLGWYGNTKNGKQCWFILLAPKNLIILTVVLGGIPLLTVGFLYTVILYQAIKNIIRLQRAQRADDENRQEIAENGLRVFRGKSAGSEITDISETTPPSGQGIIRKIFLKKPTNKVKGPNKWKAIKVVLFTSGSFILTWGPYFLTCLIYVFEQDKEYTKKLSVLIASPLAILGFFNTLINPIIYAWWHKGFRSFIKRKIDSIRRKKSSPESQPTSSKNTSSTGTGRKNSNSSGIESIGESIHIKPINNEPTT